jgi:hypothetical protein
MLERSLTVSGNWRNPGYPGPCDCQIICKTKFVDMVFPENNSKIIYVKCLILWYFSRADTIDSLESYKELTWDLFQKSQNSSYLNYINFEIFGDEIANREMIRGAIEVLNKRSFFVSASSFSGDCSDDNRLSSSLVIRVCVGLSKT